MIKKMHKDDAMLLFCAFRYALGRMTYMVQWVVSVILDRWHQIPKGTQECIQEEIREAINTGNAGMQMDVKQWSKLLDLEIK